MVTDTDRERAREIARRSIGPYVGRYEERIEEVARDIDAALAAARRGAGWRAIETAPRDFTPILVCGIGADDRPMIVKVHWGCGAHAFSSKHQCSRRPTDECEFRWMGEMGSRYGVEFTHWQPLPEPPALAGRGGATTVAGATRRG